jgi:predicted hydrocarbon binding protein
MPPEDILASLGIDPLIAGEAIRRTDAGRLVDPTGRRLVLVGAETTRGFHHVLEAEKPGTWATAMNASGTATGLTIATGLDETLAALGKPTLAALPLEACLALLQHSFTAYGWGRLRIDLNDAADHGFVVARLEHGFTVETMSSGEEFADAMIAGVLQAFFGHISGQNLGCLEIECARRGSPQCTFVITAPERLAAIAPVLGQETAEAVLKQLRQ